MRNITFSNIGSGMKWSQNSTWRERFKARQGSLVSND